MENKIPPARIECDKCHKVLIVERKAIDEINIPPEFFSEHSHMKSFTVSVVADATLSEQLSTAQ